MAEATSGSGLLAGGGAADRQSRPDYRTRTSLSPADRQLDQRYLLDRLRRHDRYLHGSGVVCGLWVVPAGEAARPWAVRVCPGYAVGVYGDEISVNDTVVIDLRDFLWARPATGFSSGIGSGIGVGVGTGIGTNIGGGIGTGVGASVGRDIDRAAIIVRRPIIYVALRAVEQLDRLMPLPGGACGCADPEYRGSRIVDAYEIAGIWTPPPPVPSAADLCDGAPACPACPDSPWLVLARVALPAASQVITAAMIDNGIRRTL